MEEIWKDIEGYDGDYQISNLGRVKSFKKCRGTNLRILKPKLNSAGYYNVNLHGNCINIQHLVWDYFGNEKRNGLLLQVDHIDNNKLNNRIDNLQLLTLRENTSKGHIVNKKSGLPLGVYFNRGKYVSRIRIGKERKILGYFNNPEDAAEAYKKELKLNG